MDVLLVDDEPAKRLALETRLARAGHTVRTRERAEDALAAVAERTPDALVTDLRLPGHDGLWLLRQVRASHAEVGVILITAYGSVESAVEAMHAGASDYLTRPFPGEELVVRLERLERQQAQAREIASLRARVAELAGPELPIGASEAFRRVLEQVRAVAPTDAPVLLVGESGTGKERVARAIHAASARRDGPFVALACATLSPTLIESELFGHEKGAFSGAHKARRGRFELACGGTLLLDDADDIPLELQPKLLRVLQERTFERVGGEAAIEVDLRVVAATKRPLDQLVATGAFREDLYYRLAVVEIPLPPLRERLEDVPLLAAHFLERARAIGPSARPAQRFGPGALARLAAHDWPGNVRELENAVQHAVAFCPGEEVGPDHLPPRLRGEVPPSGPRLVGLTLPLDYEAVLRRCERQLLDWALERAAGNQVQAARLLNLPRTTFQDKLRRQTDPSP